MMAKNSEELERIFLAVSKASTPEEAEAILKAECGDDAETTQFIRRLLQVRQKKGDLLDSAIFLRESPSQLLLSPDVAVGTTVSDDSRHETFRTRSPRTKIDQYTLLEVIGRGGLGTVWRANQEDAPYAPDVAIKILDHARISAAGVARFEEERKNLGKLLHPGIARIISGGVTPEQVPYFVMEYVDGKDLKSYLKSSSVDLHTRLRLFESICRAIHFSHQQGVIHRDLKPANILIQTVEGRPQARIIDFGISARMERNEALPSQERFSGTLEYASPQQFEAGSTPNIGDDIYSLGCVFVEILTGCGWREGLRLRKISLEEARQIILTAPKRSLRDLYAAAHIEFRPLYRSDKLNWELQAIADRCLHELPSGRFQSANELASDVENFLLHRPLSSVRNSAMYVLGKFVRRHRLSSLFATLAIVGIVATVISGVVGYLRTKDALEKESLAVANLRAEKAESDRLRVIAESSAEKATEQQQITESVSDFLLNDLLLQADPFVRAGGRRAQPIVWQPGPNPTVRQLLDRAASRLQPDTVSPDLSSRPLVYAQVLSTVGLSYVGIGEFETARTFLTRALELQKPLLPDNSPEILETQSRIARALLGSGKAADSAALFQTVVDQRRRVLGVDAADTLMTEVQLGWAMQNAGRLKEAADLYSRLEPRVRQVFSEDSPVLLGLQNNHAIVMQQMGSVEAAENLMNQVVDVRTKVLGADHPDTLSSQMNLAAMKSEAGRSPEAIPLYEDGVRRLRLQLPDDHPTVMSSLTNFALAYQRVGDLDKAIETQRAVLAAKEKKYPKDHPSTLITVTNLALALQENEAYDEALSLFERARVGIEAAFPETHVLRLSAQTNWGAILRDAGRLDEAIAVLRPALKLRQETTGVDHPFSLYTALQLGMALQLSGAHAEAEPLLSSTWEAMKTKQAIDHPDTLKAQFSLAKSRLALGNLESARSLLKDYVNQKQKSKRTAADEKLLEEAKRLLNE